MIYKSPPEADPPMAEKKKILYIITKSVWGGAGKYVYDLAANLPKDRFEVFVAAGGNGPLAQKIKEADIPYYEIKNFQRDINVLKEILAYFEILFLLFKIKPAIVHANSSKAGIIAGTACFDYRFFALKFGLKTIFTAHGWAFHENRPPWQIFLIKLFSRLTCFYYNKIICVSEFDRQSAIKNHIAPARKLMTIHNGIDSESYNFIPKEEARNKLFQMIQNSRPLDLYHDILTIGTIGEFTKNKGQKYLIDAAQKLKISAQGGSANWRIKFIIIGWGEEFENLKFQISNLKLGDSVFLINNLPDAASYLKALDIFVLPSLKEGLPYTLLEAGLAELPVIATKVGGISEIIGHDEGLLVEPAASDALAEKIEELINNPGEGKVISANLRQKIIREFSLGKMLNATLAANEENRSAGEKN